MEDYLEIAGKKFRSRLLVGTGKYRTPEEMVAALDASGAEIVTVAIRRLDLDEPGKKTLLDYIDWSKYTILPNTAACRTVEEALFTARLGREVTGSNWVKLEVVPDPKYLLPDPVGDARGREDARRARASWSCRTFTPTRCWRAICKRPAARPSCPSARPSAPARAS